MFRERALPDLSDNIKCGNSLIGPDFYDNQQMSFLDTEEHYRINVFDWKAAFPEAFADDAPGFDAVIGNPPYLNIDDTWGKGDPQQRYIKRAYSNVYNDKIDILFYFLTKAVQISKGNVAFIVSRAFLEAYKADKLRHWLAVQTDIAEIIDFQNRYIFEGVGITTAIAFFNKSSVARDAHFYRLHNPMSRIEDLARHKSDSAIFQHIEVAQELFSAEPWLFADTDTNAINRKVDAAGQPLGKVLHIGQGMQTGPNDVFGGLTLKQVQEWGLEPTEYFTRARNSDIRRYRIHDCGEILLYLEDFKRFEDLPSGVQSHLKEHDERLKQRAAYQRGDCDWWRYTWPLHREYMSRNKILCPYLATNNRFALDEQRTFLGLTDTTILYGVEQPEQLHYILGLLNSRLLTFRFTFIGKLKSAGIIEYFWNSVSKLPIRRIDFTNESDRARHDRLVALVSHLIGLRERIAEARSDHDRTVLQRQIDATDGQIDRLVYELYGLTKDEIAVVEGSVAGGR